TLNSLVVLMDLGLDPASKQARKMIDRVDKRLVFKRLNNRPYLRGETEPCINGRILGIGFARVSVATKFGSQVLPPSSENACSKWCESGVVSAKTWRTSMTLPLTVSWSINSPCPFLNSPIMGRAMVPSLLLAKLRVH